MERRRNRPEKYNREVVQKTVKAMQRIKDIRVKRQDRFWEARMAGNKAAQRAADLRELEEDIHLVRAPKSLQKAKKEEVREKERVLAEDAAMEE